jgi:hypothetical protein
VSIRPTRAPVVRSATGQVHRGGGLPHPALARAHGHDVADAGHGLPPEAAAGAHVGRHLRARDRHAGQRRHLLLRLRLHLVLDRAGGRGELDREVDGLALHAHVLHEAQGHDVLVEVRVLDGAQRVHHLLAGHAHAITSGA